MYTNILKDETPPDSPIYKDLQLIVEQAERCRGIVGGLLNFARKNQVFLVETNMVDFVNRSIDSIIRPDNVEIKFENKLSDPIAKIDKDQMMQVLTNLEKNAVEAMPKGGMLKITLSGSDHEVEMAISDTGMGIPEENMEKIFTPFFTTKEVGKGTGLGIAADLRNRQNAPGPGTGGFQCRSLERADRNNIHNKVSEMRRQNTEDRSTEVQND